jgi:hypothetical protein
MKKCDLTLIGSMTTEFRRIKIDFFSPESPQEYSILELADAVKNIQPTFFDERLDNRVDLIDVFARLFGTKHRATCSFLPDLKLGLMSWWMVVGDWICLGLSPSRRKERRRARAVAHCRSARSGVLFYAFCCAFF